MTYQELIADRVALLVEVASIERFLVAVEQHGPMPDDIDDVHRRLAAVRRVATVQVLALLDALTEAQPTLH